ncbi:MAG: bifunctional 5,10-methylenetetrahydrofolate dehydrogenase/5,10-methenyltetrahydrofolate cyclohydrolase [Nitrososphaeria archaeon]|nr:bifunctional 5,10-methylenetetrahydrofolate dehydrogenase/5,10-methenyltetrahydrofolate cyclohydrolase [Nitrososphaeria archaeon]NDB50830.1 bifunctional 5,10-methylenetetrahydrofolate dehydrogenase/5,10-methenyltetrahydrofolate cyclohydrolase [Nitrosopumilaceae archaeon]NDB88509.1 bifunctional 5,10-methylenetetrahydrofolate dehydrogenase/5,10-methenyltetrahydrofolate cyclohydrolase [Nitrososphaerota archaeon]NDB45999.1 bifunctional 5,10-methylenetetrahydrofolate dehydrogenase/5,10-methenyltet
MSGTKIDGLTVSSLVRERVKKATEELKSQGIQPCLATVLIGDNPASATYVKNKQKACAEVGIKTKDHKLPSTTTQAEMNSLIDTLNQDKEVHGILVQLPLPPQCSEFETTSRISPLKDVDGLTPHNTGLLSMKKAMLKACTPSGIMELFEHYSIPLEGKNVTVINRSNLVGKPLIHMLLEKNATVTIAHSKTKNLANVCKNADIIITGVGDRTKFTLTPEMISDGTVVIDVATSRLDGKLIGDCDFEKIIQKASFASPVPGGVGPMTIAMLLKNTVTAASMSKLGRN